MEILKIRPAILHLLSGIVEHVYLQHVVAESPTDRSRIFHAYIDIYDSEFADTKIVFCHSIHDIIANNSLVNMYIKNTWSKNGSRYRKYVKFER